MTKQGPALLRPYKLRDRPAGELSTLFQPRDEGTLQALRRLYDKYGKELSPLAAQLARLHKRMVFAGFRAGFGDIEGELLYMLVREQRPDVIFEVAPHAGYSTNYLLAAVAANGHGTVQSFEIAQRIRGVPTEVLLRRNRAEGVGGERHGLIVGDARLTVPAALRERGCDFLLIDACHEDYFAEFYWKSVLPSVSGTIFIQDIAHGDPRPEFSSEATYILSALQLSGSAFLQVGSYDTPLMQAPERDGLPPRRPLRSSSIVLYREGPPSKPPPEPELLPKLVELEGVAHPRWNNAYESFPLHARRVFARRAHTAAGDGAEDAYVHYLAGRPVEAPGGAVPFLQLVACLNSLHGTSPEMLRRLHAAFPFLDPWCRLLVTEVSVRSGDPEATGLLRSFDELHFESAEIPARLAEICMRRGLRAQAAFWIERARAAACQPSIASGYRYLLRCADLSMRLDARAPAEAAFEAAFHQPSRRDDFPRRKLSRDAFAFVLRHPTFVPLLLRHREVLDRHELVPAAKDVLRARLRAVAPLGG